MSRCIVFDFGNLIALFDHMVACQQLASWSRQTRDPAAVYERIFKTSLEEDARKPDVRFFEACIRASGRAADQIIYFDDRPDYVAAASALGIQAFVYDPALPPPAV